MRLIIQPDYRRMTNWAAHYIVKAINDYKPTADRPFVLGLPTGSSPLGTYKKLIKMNKNKEVSFKNVVTFNMDEYVGLDPNHPMSYTYFMHKNFFDHIDIPKENINIPNGNAEDLHLECKAYEEKIAQYGHVNLFVGGLGKDGHIAFNEPYSSLDSVTRVKTLTFDSRNENARFFDGDIKRVPNRAITVGIRTIMEADEVLLLISGFTKAHALWAAVEGPVSHVWTCSALQLHKRVIIATDEEATAELKVGTYKYFKEVEKYHIETDFPIED
ncbi:MAG: glucosamine-6-phosphate deaminase [Sphaerochaetaceae bacterium]|jgi:glucosamine-6-phosphate deaminase